jgi:phytanoyl-CoA hydroxylase
MISPREVEQSPDAFQSLVRESIEGLKSGSYLLKQADPGANLNFSGPRLEKAGSPFFVHFEPNVDPLTLNPDKAEFKVRKLHAYHQEHPAFQSLVKHPGIQGFVSQLVGHKVLLFGDMALAKPPFIGSAKPWHQDDAYFDYLPLDSIVTAWITLDDSTEENGCMYVMPGEHKRGALKHFHGTDCEIERDRLDLDRAVPVELKAGGAIFFSGLLPHETPPNRSKKTRRALQFQFRGENTRKVSAEDYAEVFVEADGTPASCAAARITQ